MRSGVLAPAAAILLMAAGCVLPGSTGPEHATSFCGAQLTWTEDELFETVLEAADEDTVHLDHRAPSMSLPADARQLEQAGIPNPERFHLDRVTLGSFHLGVFKGDAQVLQYGAWIDGHVTPSDRDRFQTLIEETTNLTPEEVNQTRNAFFEQDVWTGQSARQDEPRTKYEMRTYAHPTTDEFIATLDPAPAPEHPQPQQAHLILEDGQWSFQLEAETATLTSTTPEPWTLRVTAFDHATLEVDTPADRPQGLLRERVNATLNHAGLPAPELEAFSVDDGCEQPRSPGVRAPNLTQSP